MTQKPKNNTTPKRKTTPKSKTTSNSKDARHQDTRPEKTNKRVGKAKKMVLRRPNKDIISRSEKLRELRVNPEALTAQRLQKALAATGVGSRRQMEEWIEAGFVTVNGKVAKLGDKVEPKDEVKVKGKAVKLVWADRLPRILLYYKPEGEIVSRDDPQGRTSVFDRLPMTQNHRWVAIGRLDINTAGLLIFTTSGELVNRFAHPSYEIDREYSVRIPGQLTDTQMRQLTSTGIELDDGFAKAARIVETKSEGKNSWYNIVVQEGRNREVRRIFDYFGLTVSKLVRIRFGPIGIPPRLNKGQFYELNEVETVYVLREMGMPIPGDRKR